MAFKLNEPASDELRQWSLHRARLLTLFLALFLIGEGVVIMLYARRDRDTAVWGGLLFLMMGVGLAYLAWRGPWRIVRTDEEDRSVQRWIHRGSVVAKGGELLFLSLALLGLLYPSSFGVLWSSHRGWTLFIIVFAVIDLLSWLVRRIRARARTEAAA